MKTTFLSLFLLTSIIFSSCDVLLQTATTIINTEIPLTTADVANGLKEALKVGTDTAVVRLSKNNGYYLDEIVKINLPPQTEEVLKSARKVPGLDQLIEDVVKQINHSAEDAAMQAAPIFKAAIVEMSIADAWGILNGADSAATLYLKQKTYTQLFNLYQPVMQQSLNKPILAQVSAQDTWNEITGKWNQFASSLPGKILKVQTLELSLDEYVTHQALSGLFVKVSDQEKKIRTDVDARVSDLLKRVFEQK